MAGVAALALMVLAVVAHAGQPLGPWPEAAPTRPGAAPPSDAERIPLRPDGAGKAAAKSSSSSWSASRVVMSLAAVLALIFVLRWGSKRFLGISASSSLGQSIRVVGRTMLSPRQQLILLQVGKRLVLIANSGSSVSTLCQISDDDEVASLLGSAQRSKDDARGAFPSLLGKEQARLPQAETASDDPEPEAIETSADEPELKQTRAEIGGLLERVKLLSQAFKR